MDLFEEKEELLQYTLLKLGEIAAEKKTDQKKLKRAIVNVKMAINNNSVIKKLEDYLNL